VRSVKSEKCTYDRIYGRGCTPSAARESGLEKIKTGLFHVRIFLIGECHYGVISGAGRGTLLYEREMAARLEPAWGLRVGILGVRVLGVRYAWRVSGGKAHGQIRYHPFLA